MFGINVKLYVPDQKWGCAIQHLRQTYFGLVNYDHVWMISSINKRLFILTKDQLIKTIVH